MLLGVYAGIRGLVKELAEEYATKLGNWPEIIATGRTPRGHPEGLREAFANIYAEAAHERMARVLGDAVLAFPYPHIEEGAHTMAFTEACLASQARGGWVGVAKLPGV